MEFCWFAICTILAFIPWISAEEKLLYQTPTENRWGGWEVITDGFSSLNVIKLVFCCFTQYPDYKHLICQRAAFLWWSCKVHHSNIPSLSKYNGFLGCVRTDGTTPNIVGAAMLEVVVYVLAVVCKRMQQLPFMLGPAVHRGKDTTQKSL